MVAINYPPPDAHEERIARLTQAAYHAVLERGYRGSFLDLELSLWNALRDAVEQQPEPDIVRIPQ
ncbi:MAG TPA: hypothetical protein VFE62_02955 [Gemmataceae bacterium]|nr:hypothetical protein [Gemmataceae bacterium]